MATESRPVPAGIEARPPEVRPARSPAEIEADIEQTRLRLAGTVDAIVERVKPANVARRGAESAKAAVIGPDGTLRTSRVAAIAAGVLMLAGLVVWRRKH